MTKLVAIADDLTGAADCVAACASFGMRSIVALDGAGHADLGAQWPDADVVSIDANTRGLSADEAAKATATLIEKCRAHAAGAIFFKKVDSTLRGNMAAEVAAAIRAYRSAFGKQNSAMIMAPALPFQGRTTVDGCQLVHGRRLEETDLWKTEMRTPRSNIAEVLAEGGLACRVIERTVVRAGEGVLRRTLADLASQTDVMICDAESDEDLRAIARAAIEESRVCLWAGSAGLAAQVPHAMGQTRRGDEDSAGVVAGPLLIVVGSAATVSRQQADALTAQSDVVTQRISPKALLETRVWLREIVECLRRGRDTLVVLEGDQEESRRDAQIFGQSLAALMEPCAPLLGGVVATGGETARALLDGLAIDRLRLLREVEPGLPFSIADGWVRALPMLTKAGAFGSSETLIHCRNFLRRLGRTATASTPGPIAAREN